ncbi:MAG: hypothetical protein LBI03_05040, partial [Clostridiales bacterium]|nr:hypothetical protein [Clostridiales bacterium]
MATITNINMPLDMSIEQLKKTACKKAGIKLSDCKNFKILRKSVDARKKDNVHFVLSVEVSKDGPMKEDIFTKLRAVGLTFRPVVIGSGPAGLFA